MNVAPARRVALLGLIGSLCLTAALAIVALLTGDFDDTAGQILVTTAFVSLYSLLSLPAGILLDRGQYRGVAWVVIALAAVGFLLALKVVWIDWDDASEATWKSLVVVAAFCGASSQTAAVLSRRREDDSPRVRQLSWLSVALGFVLAAMIAVAALEQIDSGGYYRALGAVVVANVLFVVVGPLARRATGGRSARRETYELVFTVEDDGRSRELTVERTAASFASAVEQAITELERDGARVVRIERSS